MLLQDKYTVNGLKIKMLRTRIVYTRGSQPVLNDLPYFFHEGTLYELPKKPIHLCIITSLLPIYFIKKKK